MKCDRCGMDKMSNCQEGNILSEDRSQAKLCLNLNRSLWYEEAQKRIHPMARDAKVITKSPLFTPKATATGAPGVDMTRRNAHIQNITWGQFLPHLKLVQLCKNIKVRVLTDGDLRDIFVGNKSYKSKPISRREKEETINGLGDLLELNDDLLIIRVGFLGYQNKAGPGLLYETLLYRMSVSKPCWIFESSHSSVVWRYSKDFEVENLVNKYAQVYLTSTEPAIEDLEGMLMDGPVNDEGPSEYNSAVPEEDVGLPTPEPRPRVKTVTNLEEDHSPPPGGMGGGLLDIGKDRKFKSKRKGNWS